MSLRDGTWEAAEIPCGSIASSNDGLLVMSSALSGLFGPGGLEWYPDYGALLDGRAECTYNIGWGSESMTAHGTTETAIGSVSRTETRISRPATPATAAPVSASAMMTSGPM
jgi:hypothetical protein